MTHTVRIKLQKSILRLVCLGLVLLGLNSAIAQTPMPLVNGGDNAGTINPGDTNEWTFTANAGDNVALGLVTTNFGPQLALYGPDGVELYGNCCQADLSFGPFTATNSGTYTILVTGQGGGTGSYVLRLANFSQPFSAPAAPLTNGGDNLGTLALGALDRWSFTANTGDNVALGLVTTNFESQLALYGPDGVLLYNNCCQADLAFGPFTATNSGTYTILVEAVNGGTGPYILRLADFSQPFSVPAMPSANGGDNLGTLALGALDRWSFTANAGDNVALGLVTTNFESQLALYGPDGVLLYNNCCQADLAFGPFTATNSGTYTIFVEAVNGGTGSYILRLADFSQPFSVPAAPLANGGDNLETLAPGGLDRWSFTANAGDNVALQIVSTNFDPSVSVYGPDGVLLYNVGCCQTDVAFGPFTATNSGTYTILVTGNGTGSYVLRLADFSQPFNVPAMPLANGGDNLGTLVPGGLDRWSFTANAGDNVALQIVSTNFDPSVSVYGPDGVQLYNVGCCQTVVAFGPFTATNSGTYTILVTGNGTGSYVLRLADFSQPFSVPAMPLANGGDNLGALVNGGLDRWSFTANAGDNVALQIVSTNFNPFVSVYEPDGVQLYNVGCCQTDVALGPFTATNSGTYTILVTGNRTGSYVVRLADFSQPFSVPAMPLANGGDNLGALVNGGLDRWSFTANAGDNVALQIVSTNFNPFVSVYGPDGVQFYNVGCCQTDVALGPFTATNSGTYTILVTGNGTGPYVVRLANFSQPFSVPAMALTNGGDNLGTLVPGGLDRWSFTANVGDNVVLRLATTNFFADLAMYGPDGALLGSTSGNDDLIQWTATNGGAYTVLVSSFGGGVGAYGLRLAEMPEPFAVPAMPLVSGGNNSGTLVFGGLDLWTFDTTAGANLDLQLATTNFYGFLNLYGPNGALLASGSGNEVLIPYTTTNGGAFTAIVGSFDSGGAGGAYLLYLGGVPPPAAPSVITLPGVIQALNVETLNALVTPNGEPTEVYFQWGVTTNYGNLIGTEPATDNLYAAQTVALNISNLTSGVLHYRSVGSNSLGTTYGTDVAFTNGGAFTAGTYEFTRSAGLPARISIQGLLSAEVYDPSGLPDSLASVGPGTNGSSISFNSIFILFSATNDLPESFVYTVTNSAGDSAKGLIQITVSQPVSRFTLTGTMNLDGSATIVFFGIPDTSYVIQRSTDLVNWSDLGTLTAGADGLLQFTDPSPPTPAAFYRTRQN